jgi:hypothetical protein
VGVLSGDVHYSYLARGQSPAGATVWQVVCSPLRNPLGALFRYVNVIAFWRPIGGLGRFLARRADVRQPDLRWDIVQGPWFDNALATVTLDGRSAGVAWHKSVDADGEIGLERLCEATLA